MNILISGILGHMGREVERLCRASYRDSRLACGVDYFAEENANGVYKSFDAVDCTEEIDCIIDFSHHSLTPALLRFAVDNSIPVVLSTTGHTEEELAKIKEAAERIPIFHSGNMSLGVALLCELARTAAKTMQGAEIEIIETHHNRKIDAPSGTALMLANAIKEVRPEATTNLGRSGHGKREANEIGIHSVRMGNIVGIHEVIVATETQTITLKHEAHTRALFAEGAMCAAEFIIAREAGIYDMKSIVAGEKADAPEIVG
jgi:4-hydroxy-tetrahydrodipicolinate reductase